MIRQAHLLVALLLIASAGQAVAASADDPFLYMVELQKLEYRAGGDENSYAWEIDAWAGRDLRKIWLTLEGDKSIGSTSADMKLLYTRAISPHWNIQLGGKHDFSPGAPQDWAALIVHGLAPYQIGVEMDFYLADSGQAALEFDFSHNYRLSQKWVLHPKLEIDINSKTDTARLVGSGVNDIKLSLRLRYEARRELVPYIGLYYEKLYGDTADIAISKGEDTKELQFLIGIKAWF